MKFIIDFDVDVKGLTERGLAEQHRFIPSALREAILSFVDKKPIGYSWINHDFDIALYEEPTKPNAPATHGHKYILTVPGIEHTEAEGRDYMTAIYRLVSARLGGIEIRVYEDYQPEPDIYGAVGEMRMATELGKLHNDYAGLQNRYSQALIELSQLKRELANYKCGRNANG